MLPGMTTGPEDSELMVRYADGDAAAFDLLYDRHAGPLYRYFLRQCPDEEVAGDLFRRCGPIRRATAITPARRTSTRTPTGAVEHRRQLRPSEDGEGHLETKPAHECRTAVSAGTRQPRAGRREAFILQRKPGST